MAKVLLRGKIHKIWVRDNGDEDVEVTRTKEDLEEEIKRLEKAKIQLNRETDAWRNINQQLRTLGDQLDSLAEDNVLVATFDYPRSGSSTVTAVRPLRLQDGEERAIEWPVDEDFLTSGLFKEEVQGETQLTIHITDKDPKNPFLIFLRRLLYRVLGTITGGAFDDISNVLVKSVGEEVSEEVKNAVKPGGKDKVHVVAKSAKVKIRIEADGSLKLADLPKGVTYEDRILRLSLTAPKKVGKIKANTNNGEVALVLWSEPI